MLVTINAMLYNDHINNIIIANWKEEFKKARNFS